MGELVRPGKKNMTPGRLWWLTKRDWQRGFKASFQAHFVAPKIFEWRHPNFTTTNPVPLHVLTSEEDHVLSAWMLASWIHFTGCAWNIVLHDDGTLQPPSRDALRRTFPGIKIISRADADQAMKKILQSHPRCADYRQEHPLGLKIFDMAALEEGDRYIVVDSDVLFFRKPGAILNWCANDRSGSYFNADVAEASPVSSGEAADRLGVKLWQRVNSGICLLQRRIIDLNFCERCLAETTLLQGKIWRIEQTLFALCASHAGEGGLLPPEYEVSLGFSASPNAVARHYVGAVRHLFYGEGMARLRTELLAS
jgi:hypothetical protein